MLSTVIYISMSIFGISLSLNFFRLLRGPDAVDRILALDTLYLNGLALLVVFGVLLSTRLFFEAALLIALFGFFSTVVLCKYLLRGDVIE